MFASVGLITLHNMLSNDLYVIIAIRSGVFVPKADYVSELVDYDTEFIATFAY